VILNFTAVVTLKCRVVLPCFSFPVNSAHSVYTQHCTKQTSTECYCRLRIVSDIQRKVSTSGQLVWQAWCALKVNTHRKVCEVCFMMICRNMLYVNTRIFYVRLFRCSCCVLQAHLPSITAAGTQTHTKVTYCVCLWHSLTSAWFIIFFHIFFKLKLLCVTRKYISTYFRVSYC
jgi:hypothetical protein